MGISEISQIGNVLLANTSRMVVWPDFRPSVFRSDDSGKSWYSVLDAVYGGSSIAFCNSVTYLDADGILYSSPDTGKTWKTAATDSIFGDLVAEVISNGNSIYVRIQADALYRSDDNAKTWINLYFPKHFYNVIADNYNIYIGTSSEGFYLSYNKGFAWRTANEGFPDSSGVAAFHLIQNNIIAAISKDFQQSVFRYQLDENRWYYFNEGLSLPYTDWVYDIKSNDEYIFLVSRTGIWRRPVSDLVTRVSKPDESLKTFPLLYQNYPNPFNPITRIEYDLPFESFVELKVFNLLGQDIKTITNKYQNSGSYRIEFDGSNLPSGVYYYRLKVGNLVKTKKMIIAK